MTIKKIANKKPGIAYPMMISEDVNISKSDPSLTAFFIPRGIDIK